MKIYAVSLLICISIFTIIRAEAVQLVAASMARGVTADTIAEGVTDTFAPNTPAIHSVIVFSDVRAGDTVKAVWVAVDAIETPNYEIASTSLDLKSGDARAHFKLSRPNNGWPTGNYKLHVYVNNVFITSVPFKVKKQTARLQSAPSPARQRPERAGIIGNWQCQLSYNGMTGSSGIVSFDNAGVATVGDQRFSYALHAGNVVRLTDQAGADDYVYDISGGRLVLRYADGSAFNCVRQQAAGVAASSPDSRGRMPARGSGDEWQLQGTFCHWSGSSSYSSSSSYSNTERITFDGAGRWRFGSEVSYSGDAGMAYGGQGNQDSGTYRVDGYEIQYTSRDGERGVAKIKMRQYDGRITEILVDRKLYAIAMCE